MSNRKTNTKWLFADEKRKLDLSDDELKQLKKLKNLLGENNVLIRNDGTVTIKDYTGFVQLENLRLIIYPKIAKKLDNSKLTNEVFDIYMKMLSVSGYINVKKIPNAQNTGKYEGDMLEIFIEMFADGLFTLMKREINREYNDVQEPQVFLKGKINFGQTVKKLSFKKHVHIVDYSEFNENNFLNKIFKSTIKKLIGITNRKETKSKLVVMLKWYEEVEEITLSKQVFDKVKFNRLNKQYKPIFNLAKLFFTNDSPGINNGKIDTISFLVSGSRLFEKYAFEMLKQSKEYQNYNIKQQGPVKYLSKIKDKNCFRLKPDITLSKGEKLELIIDTKFKEVNSVRDVSNNDIYQMIAYSVGYNCNEIVLIYPKYLDDVKQISEEIELITIDKINIRVVKMQLWKKEEFTSLFNM